MDIHQQGVTQHDGLRREKSEGSPEAEQRQMIQRLLGINDVRIAEHPVGATDLVGHHLRIILQQFLAGVLLVVRNLGNHPLEAGG